MVLFKDLFSNEYFVSAASAWLVAQVLKTILYLIVNRRFEVERLIGSGGMPSSHSATVMGLLIATYFHYGVSGFPFAMALFFAIVVMHDARGVRRETGIQAHWINEMLEWMTNMGNEAIPPDIKLKEFVGHSPMQVTIGAIIGVIIGIATHYLFFS
ncbi:MAG: divergent PAP2 family protein [Lachnospiraceae bacterium]|nr:divergent PAP2 family protein [Lachnospiraceae bacterium]